MSPFRVVPIGPTRRHNAPTPGRPATRSSSETREDTTRQSHVPQWPPSRPSTPRSSARVATSRTRAPHPPPPNRCSRAPPGTSPSAPPMVRPVPDHVSLNAPVPDRSRTHALDRTHEVHPRALRPPNQHGPNPVTIKSPHATTSHHSVSAIRRTTLTFPPSTTRINQQTRRSPGSCAPRRASPWIAPPPG
jgi:hypothetical protein